MSIDLQTTYRDFPPPLLAESRIRKRVEKLERLFPRIVSCHVVAEERHQSHHKGTLYGIRVNVTIPGGEIVASRDHHDRHNHEDFYVAMRDAFDALERQLRSHAERKRGEVKTHEKLVRDEAAEPSSDVGQGD
jgi:ribosomal subunit interface protein